jgi:hypothetical protein
MWTGGSSPTRSVSHTAVTAARPAVGLVAVAGHSTGVGVARWVDGHLDQGFVSAARVLVGDPLPYPRELSHPITAGVKGDGTLYVVSNRQGALEPLTLVHLAAPP